MPSSTMSSFSYNFCHCNKTQKLPFSSSSSLVFIYLIELIYLMCGPLLLFHMMVINITSYLLIIALAMYDLTILKTNLMFMTFLWVVRHQWKNISNVPSLFHHYLCMDNRGEYIFLKSFLTTNRISHLTTPPHTLNIMVSQKSRSLYGKNQSHITLKCSHARLSLLSFMHFPPPSILLIECQKLISP